ncbi:hypothetical protein KIN20_010317 [Parelaphostrongylus tenuis]|uniref:Uncharacterized protein n=1 Tax=Parelaphostrongylus tenuis TaxID=148309 RepID=A0AAD5QLS6_PARTN|nr:hypothetical protein KIN20_010317 [Parelaphostrongylus tenuis]
MLIDVHDDGSIKHGGWCESQIVIRDTSALASTAHYLCLRTSLFNVAPSRHSITGDPQYVNTAVRIMSLGPFGSHLFFGSWIYQ